MLASLLLSATCVALAAEHFPCRGYGFGNQAPVIPVHTSHVITWCISSKDCQAHGPAQQRAAAQLQTGRTARQQTRHASSCFMQSRTTALASAHHAPHRQAIQHSNNHATPAAD